MATRTMKIVVGCAAAGVIALAAGSGISARAAQGKGRGTVVVQSVNVAGASNVPANQVVEVTFSTEIDPASVTPSTLRVFGRNATDKGYTKAVFGSLQVTGNVVRFYPRLPTHLRDPKTGDFYPEGSTQDNAAANAGFQPSTKYEVRAIGRPAITTIRSTVGRPLRETVARNFQIAPASPAEELWTTKTYSDSPATPAFSFSNPPDTVPSASTNYATHGGTHDVPSTITLSLFCTKVPLAPATTRITGNVTLTMLARKDDYNLRRPVIGSVFVEQNFDTTMLAFRPKVALADLGTYGLRVSKGVKDLTEENDFAANPERDRLRQIYEKLASGRALSPSTPVGDLPIGNDALTADWPQDKVTQGELKQAILTLGDLYPDEIDPRMMVICTTRDEPITQDELTIEFTRAEGLFDSSLSSGSVDEKVGGVPGAAAATFTAAAGSVVLGDFNPQTNTTISVDAYPLGELNYRNITIPQGVTVTFTGQRPAVLRCLTIQVSGALRADGSAGQDASSTTYSTPMSSGTGKAGGAAKLGGGKGGNTVNSFGTIGTLAAVPGGSPGYDANLTVASAAAGGRGGDGGTQGTGANGSGYSIGGGGGGGGGRSPGTKGSDGAGAYASWNGRGGAGGAGATGNDALSPLVGGAGGGGGGPGSYFYSLYLWGAPGGAGGGGGGAIMVQTAGIFTVSSTGVVSARGGVGGQGTGYSGSVWSSAPGGGGGGGSILVRSARGFNVTTPTTSLDVSGGKGGTQSGSYVAPSGGNGGAGFIRLEDPLGGAAIPGGTAGTFNPVGAGVPSYVYTKWVDLGVQDPRILPWKNGDVLTSTINDAIYVQVQMTKEHPTKFGFPDTGSINAANQSSTNTTITSQWASVKLHDKTGVVGGAFAPLFPVLPGAPSGAISDEFSGFDISGLNGKGYRFIRFRIFFQLDATQGVSSPLPYVDKITTTFLFNF